MLTLDQGKKLINLAREAISTQLNNKYFEMNNQLKEELSKRQGVFVTLSIGGNLRGCIGFTDALYPIYEGIVKAARSAAFSDPRFIPLNKEELENLSIEVSVLTTPRVIEVRNPREYLKKIKIGRDGLVVKGTFNSGLLLPQVAVEYNWNALTFLKQACIKADLPEDGWKDFDICRIYSFQSQVFSEKSPKGEVVQVM